MGASWFVRPDTHRIPLSDGEWIVVRNTLTTGELRAHLKRSSQIGSDGLRRVDMIDHGPSLVVAYLVDWSLESPIRGISEADLLMVVDLLLPPRFAEIKAAIETHEAAQAAARVAEKNGTDGETNDAATSPSRSAAAGAWSGSGV